MSNTTTEQFPRKCQHCGDMMGQVDRAQAYTCTVCGRTRCILCHARRCQPKVSVDEREERQ